MKLRILRILIAIDILAFAIITLGGSKRNETISAAAWVLEADDKWQGRVFRPVIDFILRPIEANHCYVSWLAERNKY